MESEEIIADLLKVIAWVLECGVEIKILPLEERCWDRLCNRGYYLTLRRGGRAFQIRGQTLDEVLKVLRLDHRRVFFELLCPPFPEGGD